MKTACTVRSGGKQPVTGKLTVFVTYHYFLGLRTLTVIKDAQKAIKKNYGIDIDIDNINVDKYPEVIEMMVKENTIGVFQFESTGMISMLHQMFYDIDRIHQVSGAEKDALGHEFFERLIAGISLYRPGPMQYIPDYCNGIKDPSSIHYDCEKIKPILEKTNGVIIYQEQVQEICRELAGYSYGRADLIRRAMGKKKQYIMDAEKEIFIHGNKDSYEKNNESYVPGCIANGISQEAALIIWGKMEEFAKYAFNKSHAACYAFIAFQTAFLKHFYPVEYMAALMTSVIGNKDSLPFYSNSCQKLLNINILPPDVNRSEVGFSTEGKNIRFGFEAIKAVGGKISEEIVSERNTNGEFSSAFDFVSRLISKGLNKAAMESLIKSGSFDSFENNRAELLNGYSILFTAAKAANEVSLSGQVSLFDFMDDPDSYKKPCIEAKPELPEDVILKYEREVTSLYLSGSPLKKYSKAIASSAAVPIKDVVSSIEANDNKFHNGQFVDIAVVLCDLDPKITKKGGKMLFGVVQDDETQADFMAFAKTYENYQILFKDEAVVLARAKIDLRDDGSVVFIVQRLFQMPDNSAPMAAFEAFKKEAIPYKKPVKNHNVVSERVTTPNNTKSNAKPGLYIKVKNDVELNAVCPVVVNAKAGATDVYIFREDIKKMFKAPHGVNIHDRALVTTLKSIISMDSMLMI